MKNKNKQLTLLAVCAITAMTLFAFSLSPAIKSVTQGNSIGMSGGYIITHCEALSGECTSYESDNTLTETALNHTINILIGSINGSGDSGNVVNMNWTYLELSTDGTAPDWTDSACASPVTTNGMEIAMGNTTMVTGATGNFTINHTWTATGTVAGIQKVCVSNETASAGYLMASGTFTSVSVEADDTLNILYYIGLNVSS